MENAIKILIEVANLAQAKGILSLNDAVIVAQAIAELQPKEEVSDELQSE